MSGWSSTALKVSPAWFWSLDNHCWMRTGMTVLAGKVNVSGTVAFLAAGGAF